MAANLEAPSIHETRLSTADDLLELPRDYRCELVRGEIVELAPSPGEEHGFLVQGIGAEASVFVRRNDLGRTYAAETGFKLHSDPDTVRGPDWAFVTKHRLTGPPTRKHTSVVPDIVLEVRSPDTSRREFADRADMWLREGAQVVWALDPGSRTLRVHREDSLEILGPDATLTCDDLLPGFQLPLSSVFDE